MMKNEYIYKILNKHEFENLKNYDYFLGTEKDIIDGFIHFSKKDQLIDTLTKYFKNQTDLILLKVSSHNLENLKWEKSINGEIFPHLYSKLDNKNILEDYKIKNKEDGSFILPMNC